MSKNLDLYDQIHRKDLELYNCISLLEHYTNLAVQYHICQRILHYPIAELRFYVPQFLQLLITVDTQSMALEEMIKKLCSKDPHFALMTFWHLQALLQDLAAEPESIGFQTCKRLINELQYDYFNYSTNHHTTASSMIASTGAAKAELGSKFQPNIAPSIVMATSLLAGVTVPEVTEYVSPIVKIQGRQIKAMVFEVLKDVQRNLTENLTKKNTLNNATLGGSKSQKKFIESEIKRPRSVTLTRRLSSPNPPTEDTSEVSNRKSDDLKLRVSSTDSYSTLSKKSRVSALTQLTKTHSSSALNKSKSNHITKNLSEYTHSLPDLNLPLSEGLKNEHPPHMDLSTGYSSDGSARTSTDCRNSLDTLSTSDQLTTTNAASKSNQHIKLTKEQQVKLLKSNYFKNETQFVISLQNISIRLSKVPKEARLSTLKAELSVLNSDLPCEIDIPMLLPKSKKGKLHKICRIAVNESAVLNSAERVPYLLLIEYLSDAVDFNPSLSHNKKILNNIEETGDFGTSKKNKYKFDLAYKSGKHRSQNDSETVTASTELRDEFSDPEIVESDLADVSVVKLTNKLSDTSISSTASQNNSYRRDSDYITGQLRIASIMLQQLQSPNSPIPADQAADLKQRIIESMNVKQQELAKTTDELAEPAGERKLMNDMKVAGLSYLGEDWQSKKERIRKESPYGHLENWDLFSMIAKTGDDLAQEAFACQLIQLMANIWYQDKVKVWVKKMKILVTSISTGLVETITNAVSVHSIKKALEQHMIDQGQVPVGIALKDHFKLLFGDENGEKYQRAQENFAKSLSAYSVICYILQIKDRHNGNIMFDSEGHIVHIDFGFLLSNSPGSIGFEAAPFKLTQEYVDILGGTESYYFKYFVELTKAAFKSLRNHADVIVDMVELMQKDSSLPCFMLGANTSIKLKQRFELAMSDEEVENFIEVLISKSLNSAYTKLYDQFQLMTQGIYI